MKANKPVRDSACKGAVQKRSQRALEILGEATWIKPSPQTTDKKKAPAEKPYTGVRKEK